MNETQEFGACTSIVTEMRFIGMNADQSRELEGPIVAAVCRHFGLQPEAVTVLGHRTVSVHNYDGTSIPSHRFLMTFPMNFLATYRKCDPTFAECLYNLRTLLIFCEIRGKIGKL